MILAKPKSTLGCVTVWLSYQTVLLRPAAVLRLRQVVSGMETPRSVDALEVEVTEVAMGDSEEAAHDLVLEGVAASPMVELVF